MPIERSTAIWGEHEIRSDLPAVRTVIDACVMPQVSTSHLDTRWGVYDPDGRLVEEAALVRGPGRILVGQSETIAPVTNATRLDGTYLYGGSAHGHYGHYLLEFLPRYWAMRRSDLSGMKILIHEIPNFAGWMALPFVSKTLGALGLDRSDFLTITEPTIVETLVVAAASFISQKRAHEVFSEMCAAIGNALCSSGDAADDLTDQPIFLSKEHLTHGVWNIRNEASFTEVLKAAGIRVVHPELLGLEDQIRLFKHHKTIGGIMGSALHTALFCATPKTIVALGHNAFVHADFVLVDGIKNNSSCFYHLAEGMDAHGATPDFQGSFSFKDPVAAGTEFARLLLDS